MIIEFRCMNDECPALEDVKFDNDGDFDDEDRFEWYGGKMAETRIDPACYTDEECKYCGHAGEIIGEYTPRELRELNDPRL